MRAYKVYAIKNGTVIDHIPATKGMQIIELLKLQQWNKAVTLGAGFKSKKHGKKDIIKIEDKELSPEEVNKIAVIAPTATINIIRDFKISKKFRPQLPEVLEAIIKCPNPACVTNHDPVAKTRFYKEPGKKFEISCAYCERYFSDLDIELL
ncbi:MAG: aspartate carbamoyltransferase regulatory subunit [Patescibacteria group bacterium]|jgi:aspartate carbamoyltransferase regulatory subunit